MQELRFSEFCANCRKSLADVEAVLFVEKEMGRCFCSEDCIREYFQPTVDAMHEELERQRGRGDYGDGTSARFAQYRALTLEDPDEVWMNQTESGERHFTFISHFRNGEERFSYICVCLTIEGMPSFVLLGVATRDEDLVDEYRCGIEFLGEQHPHGQPPDGAVESGARSVDPAAPDSPDSNALWERIFEGEGGKPSNDLRKPDDIPSEQFADFAHFIEPTMDDPDEIWTFLDEEKRKWLTFISIYKEEDEDESYFSMIVVCRLGEDKGMKVVSAFPTVDPEFLQKFRRGIQSLNKAFGVGWTRGRAA